MFCPYLSRSPWQLGGNLNSIKKTSNNDRSYIVSLLHTLLIKIYFKIFKKSFENFPQRDLISYGESKLIFVLGIMAWLATKDKKFRFQHLLNWPFGNFYTKILWPFLVSMDTMDSFLKLKDIARSSQGW